VLSAVALCVDGSSRGTVQGLRPVNGSVAAHSRHAGRRGRNGTERAAGRWEQRMFILCTVDPSYRGAADVVVKRVIQCYLAVLQGLPANSRYDDAGALE